MDVKRVLKGHDVRGVGDFAAEFGQHGDGDLEDAGRGDVGLAFDFAGEGGGLRTLGARDETEGDEGEGERESEHVGGHE